jgi:RNA polymerase sigma-70 factor (ECF subfamily)
MRNEAFEKTVMVHKDRVHAYAALMLGNPVEAQDVAQEAMIRLWQQRGRVNGQGARPWLMRTAHNLCIDSIRKRKVRAEVDEGDAVIDRQRGVEPGAEQLTESSELGRAIHKELEGMLPQDRAVIIMREVQGLPYGEIAEALGLPLGTLKARLHRARDRLRSRLSRVGVMP